MPASARRLVYLIETYPAGGRPGPARPRDRAERHRQFRGQPIDDDHRRESGGRRRHRGGDRRHQPVQQPAEAGELFRAESAGAAVRAGAAHHGRISKNGRSHARAMLVEAAWAAAKATGPLHAFFVRIRARRGHQIVAVAVARKLTVLCWHSLTKGEDYLWARRSLVANKTRAMQLQAIHNRKAAGAGQPMPTTSRRYATARC